MRLLRPCRAGQGTAGQGDREGLAGLGEVPDQGIDPQGARERGGTGNVRDREADPIPVPLNLCQRAPRSAPIAGTSMVPASDSSPVRWTPMSNG